MMLVISLWAFTCPFVSFSASGMRTHAFLPEPQPQLVFVLRATVPAGEFERLHSGCAHISKVQQGQIWGLQHLVLVCCVHSGGDLLGIALIWPYGLEHSIATGTRWVSFWSTSCHLVLSEKNLVLQCGPTCSKVRSYLRRAVLVLSKTQAHRDGEESGRSPSDLHLIGGNG